MTVRCYRNEREWIISKVLECEVKVSFTGTRHYTEANGQLSALASLSPSIVECVWNVTAHAQIPDFVLRRNGRVHLNRRGRQFSRLLAAEVCASAVVIVVMLDTPRSEVKWRVLATHSIHQFPLHFPSLASPCAITFQLDSSSVTHWIGVGWVQRRSGIFEDPKFPVLLLGTWPGSSLFISVRCVIRQKQTGTLCPKS